MQNKISLGMPSGVFGLGVKPNMGVGFQLPQDMQFANMPSQLDYPALMMMLKQQYMLNNGMPQMQQLPSGGLLGGVK